MASRYLVIVLSTSTANKTIVLFFYISKLVHIFNCCLDKNLPIFTFKSNPPKKNRKTSQKYSLCLCHFSRISSAPGSNSSTYRSNNLFKVKDMEPKSWNTTQIITGWPIRLWQTQHWGVFWSLWEPSWAMTQESVSCIRGLRFRITIFYNIVLFGDVPL